MGDSSRVLLTAARGGSYFLNGSRPLETERLAGFFAAGSVSWAIAVITSPLIRIRAVVNTTPASRLIDVLVPCLVIIVFTSSDASRAIT
jgi:hypothetical protein